MLLSLLTERIDPASALTLKLPWPPSVNRYWRHAARGGHAVTYVSRDGLDYKTAVAEAVREQATGHMPYSGQVAVRVVLYPPSKREYDADNRLKGLFDALTQAGVWVDDKLAREIHVAKEVPCPPKGRAVVTIWRIMQGAA